MNQLDRRLVSEFADKEYRHSYADNFINTYIAAQIRALRDQRGWTQAQLAERAEMKQSRISAMEDVNHSSWSVRTLARLAEAFDVALSVCFKSFSSRLADIEGFSPSALVVPPYTDDVLLSLHVGTPPQLAESSPLAALANRLVQMFVGFNAEPVPNRAREIQEHAASLLETVDRMYGKTSKQYAEFRAWVVDLLTSVVATAQSHVMSPAEEAQAVARIKTIDEEIKRLREENRAIEERQRQAREAVERETQEKIQAAWAAAAKEIERVQSDAQKFTDGIQQAVVQIVGGLVSTATAIAAQREVINRIADAIAAASVDAELAEALRRAERDLHAVEQRVETVEQRAGELVHAA
jgi:HTH-type transcriptional regulator/antitoxin HipB